VNKFFDQEKAEAIVVISGTANQLSKLIQKAAK
jgi:hypothetical protein